MQVRIPILAFALTALSPAGVRAQSDTAAIDPETRAALTTVLEAVERMSREGPICLALRYPRGQEIVPPSWVLRLNPRLRLVRPKNCPATYATNGGYVDPETGVREGPLRPLGYSDPHVLTVTIHPHSPSALPRLGVRLQQGTGWRFGDCDYSTNLRTYLCSLTGVGFN
jgi:hypothetical protein